LTKYIQTDFATTTTTTTKLDNYKLDVKLPEYDFVDWHRNSQERTGIMLDQDEEEEKGSEIIGNSTSLTSSLLDLPLYTMSGGNETQTSSEESDASTTLTLKSTAITDSSTHTQTANALPLSIGRFDKGTPLVIGHNVTVLSNATKDDNIPIAVPLPRVNEGLLLPVIVWYIFLFNLLNFNNL
jgi:hypothetical protein